MNIFSLIKPVKVQGKLAELSDAQRQQLLEWLNTTQTYEEIGKRVKTDFGVAGVTRHILKNFRKKEYIRLKETNPHCPRPVPMEIWRFSLGKMVAVLADPDTPIEVRVRVSAFLLQLSRVTLEHEKSNAKPRARKGGKSGSGNDNQAVPEENSFDDQDKLDEARREVFGCVPE